MCPENPNCTTIHTGAAPPTSAVSSVAATTAAPATADAHAMFAKLDGRLSTDSDGGLRVEFVPKPFIPAHPILAGLTTLGFIAGETYEPGGLFGSLAISGPLNGLRAIPKICGTDWKSKASWLADTASTCYSGLTSNIGSITASDAAPWLLFGAAAGLSALAYKSYYSDDSQSDPDKATEKSDVQTKRGKTLASATTSLNRLGASTHDILPPRLA